MAKFESEMKPLHHAEEIQMPFETDQEFYHQKGHFIFVNGDVTIDNHGN